MDTLKTNINFYYFNVRNENEAEQYKELTTKLKALDLHFMNAWGGSDTSILRRENTTEEIEIELKHIFNDQWNSAPCFGSELGWRVHDWYEEYTRNHNIKRGYWLELTPELKAVRDNTINCGYCGRQQPAQTGHVFCDKCLNSEYLKKDDLHLLRMLRLSEKWSKKRAPLTEAESAWLLPQYQAAQKERLRLKKIKMYADLKAQAEKAKKEADIKLEGYSWLLDNGQNIENCIYYSHTGKFSFGWREQLTDSEKSDLLDLLCEFPFDYEIKDKS